MSQVRILPGAQHHRRSKPYSWGDSELVGAVYEFRARILPTFGAGFDGETAGQQPIDCDSDSLDVGLVQVAVAVQRETRRRVTQHVLQALDVRPGLDGQRRRSVA